MKKKLLNVSLIVALGFSASAFGMNREEQIRLAPKVKEEKGFWTPWRKLGVASTVLAVAGVGLWASGFYEKKSGWDLIGMRKQGSKLFGLGALAGGIFGTAIGFSVDPVEKKANKLIEEGVEKVIGFKETAEDTIAALGKKAKRPLRDMKAIQQSVLKARMEKREKRRREKELLGRTYVVSGPSGGVLQFAKDDHFVPTRIEDLMRSSATAIVSNSALEENEDGLRDSLIKEFDIVGGAGDLEVV